MRHSFDCHERQAFLELLVRAEDEAGRGEVWPGTLSDIAAVMRQICAGADLVIDSGMVDFTASVDYKRYFVTKAGLWRFGDVREPVTAHEWWMAALQTRAHFVNLHLEV